MGSSGTPPDSPKKAAIIDLMAEVFRHGSKLSQYKDPALRSEFPYPLTSRVLNSIMGIVHRTSSGIGNSGPVTHLVIANDSSIPGFRKKIIDEEYKANRTDDDHKPITEEDETFIKNYLQSKEGKEDISYLVSTLRTLGIPVLDAPGHEGDDVMAWAHKTLRKELGRDVPIEIYSQDKDMHTLLRDPNTRQYAERSINRENFSGSQISANLRIKPYQYSDYLALAGDTSDNIPRLFRSDEARDLLTYMDNNRSKEWNFSTGSHGTLWNFFSSDPSDIPPEFRAHWMKLHYGISIPKANSLLSKSNFDVAQAVDQFQLQPTGNIDRLSTNMKLSKLYSDIGYLDDQYEGKSLAKDSELKRPGTSEQAANVRAALQPLSPEVQTSYFNMSRIPRADASDKDKFKFFQSIGSLAEGFAQSMTRDIPPSEADYRKRFEEAGDLQRVLFDAMRKTEGKPLLHPFYVGGKYKQYVPIVRIHEPKALHSDDPSSFYDVVSTEGGLFARPSGSSNWHHALGYTPETGLVIHPYSATAYEGQYPRISNISDWLNTTIGNTGQQSNGFYEFTRGDEDEKEFLSHLKYNVHAQVGSPTPDMLWRRFNEFEKQQRGVALGTASSLSSSSMPMQAAQEALLHFLAMGIHGGRDPQFHAGIWPSPGENAGSWEPYVSGPWKSAIGAREILSRELPPAASSPIHTTLGDYGRALFSGSSPYNASDMALIIPATEEQALEYAKTGIPKDKMPTSRKESEGARLMRMEELREQLARSMDAFGNPTSDYGASIFSHPLLQTSSATQPTHFVIAHIPKEQAVIRQHFKGAGHNNNYGVPPIHSSHIVAQIPIASIPRMSTDYLPNATEPSKMTTYDAS